ncbi:unnamed protein product, partial [Arctogadus glacialis]
ACDLTLDPNTAHGHLSLSEDNRKVTWVEEDQSYPDHPDRFDSVPQVLGREALTGRCYWESVPRWRRVLRHTDTHPHLLLLLHPGGPPPGGEAMGVL